MGIKMTGLELKVARELLGMSQYEAAEHIGNVHQRSWAFWETGERSIKEDVEKTINFLLERRREIIRQFVNSQDRNKAQKVAVVYYPTPDFCSSYLEWKFSQSLARTLSLDFGATIVEFSHEDFKEFIVQNKLLDTPATRAQWAATKISS